MDQKLPSQADTAVPTKPKKKLSLGEDGTDAIPFEGVEVCNRDNISTRYCGCNKEMNENENNENENNESDESDESDESKSGESDHQDELDTICTVKSPVEKNDTHYNMNHKKRGRCVIFNNYRFKDRNLNRKGSKVDAKGIKQVFGVTLGFDVIEHPNLKINEIENAVQALGKENFEDEDCLCVFILTHGKENGALMAYDHVYYLKDIWKRFIGNRCHTLVGKPKLFIVQACKGSKYDDGVEVRLRGGSHETDMSDTDSYKIPNCADFLFGYSTIEDYASWRNTKRGSIYIQQLCTVIQKNWETQDLVSMLLTVAREVANNYSSVNKDECMNRRKQIPSTLITLTRYILFTKKDS